ncbi:MAG TPA: hypothetical protein PL183_05500 [Aquamicrobium sp.]|nr:hypothetical protein [Aquamicrobium sp.]
MTIDNTPFLRNVLLADAAMGAAAAALTIIGSGLLAPLLGLPEALLFWAGVALVPVAAFLLVMARRALVPRSWLREIVFVNWAWVAASLGMLAFAPIAPNALGIIFILAQAAAVAGFAVLEGLALRGAREAVA